jgi:AcrR family transcriptional regulator
MEHKLMPTQAERRDTTIRALEQVAQNLFETRGFTDTTVDDIVTKAGVAKGAFYHHYDSKESMFESVVDLVQASLAREVANIASKGVSPVAQLRLGLSAYMAACNRPRIKRVLLLDGPSVLGWPRWRDIDNKYFGEMTRRAVAAALGPKARTLHVRAVASLISGAFAEAAMLSAASEQSAYTPTDLCAAMDVLLIGLETEAKSAPRKGGRRPA